MLSDTGLKVLEVFSFYLEPETDIESFRPALELGADLGAAYAMVMGRDPDWSRTCDNFAAIVDVIEGYCMVPALEPAVSRPLASHRLCERLIAETGRTGAAICVDQLNLCRAGEGAADLAAIDPARFPFAQLTDGYLDPGPFDPAMVGHMGPNRRAMLGEGDLPLAEILDALPHGIPLSVETPISIGIDKGLAPDAATWAKISLENAREFLAAYEAGRVA
jgi:sugar phosphate isomerase/epimerase